MVHGAGTCEAAQSDRIESWDRERCDDPGASRNILTHTNAQARALNKAARGCLHTNRELGQDVRIKTERGDRDYARRDCIMFPQGERSLEVKNGTHGTIEQVSKRSVTVRSDDGRSVALDIKSDRDLGRFGNSTVRQFARRRRPCTGGANTGVMTKNPERDAPASRSDRKVLLTEMSQRLSG